MRKPLRPKIRPVPCALALSVLGWVLLAPGWTWADEPHADPVAALSEAVNEAQRRGGNDLTVLDALRARAPQELDFKSPHYAADSLTLQVSSHYAAVVGDYREALRLYPAAGYMPASAAAAAGFPGDSWQPQPALQVLDSLVTGVHIVMLNEAHHVPQHRAFAIQLLTLLRSKGFSIFAAEALTAADTGLQSRGYPTHQSGYYTAEPVYGDLIRTALRLGFRVVAYESDSQDAEAREQGQASNLFERVFKPDPGAKILIYAGYAHIDKRGPGLAGVVPLAARLGQMTGQEPLTIDQTFMREVLPQQREHPLYQSIMAHAPVLEPTIFLNAQGKPWTLKPGIHDVTLVQPRSVYVDGRPTWLTLAGTRSPYRLPGSLCGTASRCLVKARVSSESADAIPVDELAVTDQGPAAVLMLPKGRFVLEVQDAAGKAVKSLQAEQR